MNPREKWFYNRMKSDGFLAYRKSHARTASLMALALFDPYGEDLDRLLCWEMSE